MIALPVLGQQNTLEQEEEKQTNFSYYLQNPFDINLVSPKELQTLGILTQDQINHFLVHRKSIGAFESIYELQVIPDWDLNLLKKISPFLTCSKINVTWYEMEDPHTQILMRAEKSVEQKKGFSPPDARSKSRYKGGELNQLIRVRSKYNKIIRAGVLIQKDPGEANWADFSSYFVEIKPNKIIDKIILGDFINQWGQGLIQAGGFSLGKSYESIKATQKFHLGGLPYSSSGETGFYRGMQANTHWKNFSGQGFYSHRNLDATIMYDSIANTNKIKSWVVDGLHRTTTEISHQNTVIEKTWGTSIQWILLEKNLSIQWNFVQTEWSIPKAKPTSDYKMADWSGQKLQNQSVSFHIPIQNVQFMGEIATHDANGLAIIQGAAWAQSKKIDFSYLLRYYTPNYYSPMAQGISENTNTSNEIGLFLGNQFQINKRTKISSYIDLFTFPHIKYQVSKPNSWGWEALSRFQTERKNKWRFFGQLKWSTKQGDGPRKTSPLIRNHNIQMSLDLHQYVHRKINFHTRIMACLSTNPIESNTGLLCLQDVQWKTKKWSIQARIGFISTSSYDSRLYAYEPGVPSSFLLPGFYDHGIRNCLILDYKTRFQGIISLKLARTNYFDRQEIGSSLDLINQSHKTDITIQYLVNL